MPTKLVLVSTWTLGLLFGMLGVIIYLIMFATKSVNIWLLIGLTIVVNIGIWLASPKILDWVQRIFYKMRFISREELAAQYPELEKFVAEVCQKQNMPFPKIGFINDNNPTAFSYGSGRWNARVVFTQGILTYLEPAEVKAVLGHELGHIVHRDFIVMSIANTILQILYEIFYVLVRGRRNSGGKGTPLDIIALVAYVFYWIGIYIVLFLSRIREYYADYFSAEVTQSPEDLSRALIKIAYGIMAKEDTDNSKRLLESTRTLGIMGFRTAKQVGLAAKVTNMEPAKLTSVLMFDIISPWAKLAELSSTHPLTGKRLLRLDKAAQQLGHASVFNLAEMRRTTVVDRGRLWRSFFGGAFMYFMPIILGLISIADGFLIYALAPPQLVVYVGAPVIISLLLLLRVLYKYPSIRKARPTTALSLMSDLYASPLRGRPAEISGQVVGRGTPGYVFSEDMMLQDSTGLLYLDYRGPYPLVSKLRFALKRLATLFGQPMTARGWFFRSNTQKVVLKSITTESAVIKSYARFWSFVGMLLLAVLFSIPPIIGAMKAPEGAQQRVLPVVHTTQLVAGTEYTTQCYILKLPQAAEIRQRDNSRPCEIDFTYPANMDIDHSDTFHIRGELSVDGFQADVAADKTDVASRTNTTVNGLEVTQVIKHFGASSSNDYMTTYVDTTRLITRAPTSSSSSATPYYFSIDSGAQPLDKTLVSEILTGLTWKQTALAP